VNFYLTLRKEFTFMSYSNAPMQATLGHKVTCQGVALHSGAQVNMTLHPADVDHGIVFVRTDCPAEQSLVAAQYDLVTETTLCTVLTNEYGVQVMTVEHVMAALWGMGITNCRIELDGPEIPIMDGSSEPFVFLIECAGVKVQDAPRAILQVLREITVEDRGCTATIAPRARGFRLEAEIDFDHQAIGAQHGCYDFNLTSFKQSLCRARTFGFLKDVKALQANGLARGGSLHNAIVLDENGVMNPEGLRYRDEFIRHKSLDAVGDYYLCGYALQADVTTFRPGHRINNLLMRELMADARNYQIITSDQVLEIPSEMLVAMPMAALAAHA
jgi:UDP-3-O-[3-hydroxymyristoyl] N-acetylglucosamine deacetylase